MSNQEPKEGAPLPPATALCLRCGREMVGEAESVEHIIPRALGGKLKSKVLYCRACNTQLGNEVDEPFFNQFTYFCTSLNIRREGRGKLPDIPAIHVASGAKVALGAHLKARTTEMSVKPVGTDATGNQKQQITAPNHEKAQEMLRGIQEKAAKEGKQVVVEKTVVNKLEGPVRVEIDFGGPKTFRGAAKIVLGLHIHRGGSRTDVDALRKFVVGENTGHPAWLHYIPELFPKDQLTHDVMVATDVSGTLWGVVSIFGVSSVIVKMGGPVSKPVQWHYRHVISEAKGSLIDASWVPSGEDLEQVLQVADMPVADMKKHVDGVQRLIRARSVAADALADVSDEWKRFVAGGKTMVDAEMLEGLVKTTVLGIAPHLKLTREEEDEVVRLLMLPLKEWDDEAEAEDDGEATDLESGKR